MAPSPDLLHGDEIDWTEKDELIADIAWAKLRIRWTPEEGDQEADCATWRCSHGQSSGSRSSASSRSSSARKRASRGA